MTNNLNLKESEYYIAYLDILGSKNFIKRDSDKFLNNLYKIINDAVQDKIIMNEEQNVSMDRKIFSDNMLFYAKLNSNPDTNIKTIRAIIKLCSLIQTKALEKGYMIRGAITKGGFFEETQRHLFVYGEALVEAVLLEENIAIYPRIIIADKILDDACSNEISSFVLADNDGIKYIDTYKLLESENFGKLKIYKKMLLKILKNVDNERTKQKIVWFISYHNRFCENNKTLIYDNNKKYKIKNNYKCKI